MRAPFLGHVSTTTPPRIKLDERDAFERHVLRLVGKDIEVIVREHREQRSNAQNAYYWFIVLGTLSRATDDSYSPEEWHEILKAKFLPKSLPIVDRKGELVDAYVIGGSTTDLNTAQMEDYLQKIREWAHDTLGVVIPLPNEGTRYAPQADGFPT